MVVSDSVSFLCESTLGTDLLQLVLVEHGEGVDDHPRDRPAKVDDLVHEEAHEAGREGVILHPKIPRLYIVQR